MFLAALVNPEGDLAASDSSTRQSKGRKGSVSGRGQPLGIPGIKRRQEAVACCRWHLEETIGQ